MEEPPAKRVRLDETIAANGDAPEEQLDPLSLAYRLSQQDSLSAEQLVGISAYVNPSLPAFESAIIKHRFTDFMVWEISKAGQVVKLENLERPETKASNTEDVQERAEDNKDNINLEDHMTAAKVEELQAFVQAGKSSNAKLRSDPIESRDARKAFHNAIRTVFEGKLSTTAEEGGAISITWNTGSAQDRRGSRPSKRDQRDLPAYIQFTLQKTNRETQDCLSHLTTRLGVNPKDLTTAGTKDKRAVTTQQVTLKRGKRVLEDVWDRIHASRGRGKKVEKQSERGERGLRIADLEYVEKPLELGILQGNRFCIALRELKGPSDEDIASAMNTLQTTGFINYYGMQRFGNSSVPTHAIGLALLRGDWKEAARMVLCEKDGDSDDLRSARRAWNEDQNAKQALRGMPRWAVAERSMLEFYAKASNAGNHNGALSCIPKNLRLMYVHAYQSYVWNSAVSERIKKFGCDKPIVGDLVYDQDVGEHSLEPADTPTAGQITQESLQATSKVAKVRVLKEDDLDSAQIQDVVLPLPGYSVTYPEGELGTLYRNMLKADGLDADQMFRKQKEYSLGGAYRKILTRPKNVSWELLQYSELDEDLLQPDEDKLLGMEIAIQPGDRRALKVEFDLDTASYATMALREILKMETGNVQQKAFSESTSKA